MLLKKSVLMGPVSVLLSCHIILAQQVPAGLTIKVVQGDGAVNLVNQKPLQVPAVRVADSSGRAVPGAKVSFRTPDSGPSATFQGALAVSAVTGPDGIARASGFTPNGEAGPFAVNVIAEYDGQTAQQQVTQNNVAAPAKSSHHGLALKLAIGAAAVAGFSYLMYAEFVAKNKPYGQR
jgi:hypothetical protein